MQCTTRFLAAAASLSAVAVLTACGGGSSDSSGGGTTTKYSIGVAISGLGSSLSVILQDNGGDNLTANDSGSFTFATQVASGRAYSVTVLTQPTGQTCTVTQGSNTVASANITVAVNCVYNASNASLTGAYTGLFYEINNGSNVPDVFIGTENFSGAGDFTLPTATINLGGMILSNATVNLSGNYDLAANGTSSGNSVVNGGIIGQNANAYIATDIVAGDQPLVGIAVKVGSGLSTASLEGNFTNVNLRYGANGDEGNLSTWTFDGSGNATGTDSSNDSGVITTGAASLSPLTVAANGAITAADGTMGALSPDTNLLVYGVFNSGATPKFGVAVRTGSAMTLTAVSGQYTGADYYGELAGGFAGVTGTVVSVILDGQGNFSGTATANTAGTVSSGSASGTYTVQADGTVTVQGANGIGSYQGAVSADGNAIVLSNMTSGDPPEIVVLFRQ